MRRAFLASLGVLAVILNSGVGAEQDARKAALARVAQQFRAPLLMEGLDPTTPEARAAAAALDRSVDDLLATQIADPHADGYGGWDPKLTVKSDEISFNGAYFRRSLQLAHAWACPASKYYHAQQAATALNRAIEYVLPLLEKHQRPNNWWAWDIGIPQRLGDTLIFAGDALTPTLRQRATNELVHLTKREQLPACEGANNAWRAMVQMRTAIVTGNARYLDFASVTMSRLLEAGKAIQPDYSYFFHGPGLNAGYGLSHWNTVCRFARATDGTPWQLTPAAQTKLLAWTQNFFRYNAWRGTWSPWSIGRSRTRAFGGSSMPIRRPTTTMDALSIARPMLEIAHADTWPLQQRQELMTMALEHVAGIASPSDDPSIYYLLHKTDMQPGGFISGAKYFPYTDYLTARRPGWYAAVRLNSTRTKTWFTLHGENLLGCEQAEGSLALMTAPHQFAYDVLTTLPYGDLPGVTRQAELTRRPDAKGEATQTGGVVLDNVGLAGFDYRLTGPAKKLRANKSYLILPNAIVLVGSGIQSEGDGEVNTTLLLVPKAEQDADWRLDKETQDWSPQTKSLAGNHSLRLGTIGLVTLAPMPLELEIQTVTANSQRINRIYSDNKTYTRCYGSVRVKHGRKPGDGSYAAALLPAATADEVAQFAAQPTIHVLANRPEAHVLQTDVGVTAASFFSKARIDKAIGSDGPLYLLLKRTARNVALAIMAPPALEFGAKVQRTIWLPNRYRLAQQTAEVVKLDSQPNGTELTLTLATGKPLELTLTEDETQN